MIKMVEMTKICTLILLTWTLACGSNVMENPTGGKILNFLMKNQYLPEVNEMFEDADRTRDKNEETLDKACKKSKEEMSQDSSKENPFPFDNEPPVNYDQLPEFMEKKRVLMRKKTFPEIMRILKKIARKSQAVNGIGEESPVLEGLQDRIGTVSVDDASEWTQNKIIDSFLPNNFNGTECEFETDFVMATGLCTQFGSCRVDKEDYMYQGGCGELSEWGSVPITNTQVSCTMRMDVKNVHHGWCTDDGHCRAADRIKEESMDCFFKLIEESNTELIKKKMKQKKQERKFLPTLCKFMGGLGNVLHYTYITYP